MIRLFVACFVLAVFVAACSGPRPHSDGDAYQASRYSQDQDAAPLEPIEPGDVKDAVPRAEPLLAVGNKSPYTVNGVSYEILDDYRNYREQGIASWYGSKFHGHETSNGEIFDTYAASAAHKTLPIPSYVRVTNLQNGRSMTVRVNDRGPFHPERLIDLSYGAAVKLGFMEHGTAPVEVAVLNIAGVDDLRNVPGGHYRYLQLGAFSTQSSASQLQAELQAFLPVPVFLKEADVHGSRLYRVRVGPVADAEQMQLVQQQLRDVGYSAGQPLP